MANLDVGVFGAAGKMGAITCQAINNSDSMTLCLGVDSNQVGTLIPNTSLQIQGTVESLEGIDVMVDFTVAEAAMENLKLAAQAGVRYSIDKPGKYIDSNIVGFGNLLESLRISNVEHFLYAKLLYLIQLL